MTTTSDLPSAASTAVAVAQAGKSRGFWAESWIHFRRRPMSVLALIYVGFLIVVALTAPAIAGTKPLVAYYKGQIYFPVLGYYNRAWEDPIFQKDKFRGRYSPNLQNKDPNSWAIWPLVFQDPYRRVRGDEWPGQPANPSGDQGRPSRYNWFGTDQEGVDIFAQMVHGTSVALSVGFLSMGIASIIGISIGSVGGYFGGWVDMILSRFTEVVMCVPPLILILAFIAILQKPTIWHVMAILGMTGWTSIARLTRAEFIKLRDADYVLAARAMGVQWTRIIFRHILPNALTPVLVPIIFGIAAAILTEAALSFLGFGVPPPNPSWGKLLSAGRSNYQMWWLIFFPGLAIFLTVLAYNLIGEGMQEATDPRVREAKS